MRNNADIRLTPHFKLREFLHNGSHEGVTSEIVENLKELAQSLEEVRTLLGDKPIKITSGFRSWKHHVEIYRDMGITDLDAIPQGSYHLTGRAADFIVIGMPSSEARKILDPIWHGGMERGTKHVHLDLGPNRRFYP
jgi:uncharacterized protein YcbK (DUF882 family)